MTVRRTIVELDLVGYSGISAQLEQAGDASSVAKLCAQIQSFVDAGLDAARVARADSVFKTTGDGALLALASPEIAHRFAATVHEATRQHNLDKTLPIGLRVFRIGVATGEVDVQEIDGRTDHFGDTVSRACRLEAKASPGGVLIDKHTYANLPPDLQSLYRGPEVIHGKREERYEAWAWQGNHDGPADAVRLGAGPTAANVSQGRTPSPNGDTGECVGSFNGGLEAGAASRESVHMEATLGTNLDFAKVPEQMRALLCDMKRMRSAFSGPWVQALVGQLRESLDARLDDSVASVVDCFLSARADQIKSLFHAIRKASEAVAPDRDVAKTWAVQFTLLAALRCIRPECWTDFERILSDPRSPKGLVGRAATSNALIASVGVAGLLGQVIHVDTDRRLPGVIDLHHTAPHVDVQRLILGQIYDQLFSAPGSRRGDPNAPLTEVQEGQIRMHFDDLREDRMFGAIVLRLPELDGADALKTCRSVAKAINATVISGLTAHADIVYAETGLTVGELEARLEQLIGLAETGSPNTAEPVRRAPSAPVGLVEAGLPNTAESVRRAPSALVELAEAGSPTTSEPGRRAPSAPPVASSQPYDVFISYASEDREPFVSELHRELASLGLKVWRDQGVLTLGDGLMHSINQGLADSRYAVVILSEAFLAKPWPQQELQAVFSRQMLEQRKCILPVLLGIEHDRVVRSLPLLGGKLCSHASHGATSVAQDVFKAVIAGR